MTLARDKHNATQSQDPEQYTARFRHHLGESLLEARQKSAEVVTGTLNGDCLDNMDEVCGRKVRHVKVIRVGPGLLTWLGECQFMPDRLARGVRQILGHQDKGPRASIKSKAGEPQRVVLDQRSLIDRLDIEGK